MNYACDLQFFYSSLIKRYTTMLNTYNVYIKAILFYESFYHQYNIW